MSGPRAWISRYAWGDDYHTVLGEKLEALIAVMTEKFGQGKFVARAYVDTGPVSERIAARQAGLGWLAKNTCLINETLGSWLFLGVILTTLDLAPSGPEETLPRPPCRRPTSAATAPCAWKPAPPAPSSSHTFSMPAAAFPTSPSNCATRIPEEFRAPIGRQVFGCDICQDVCPWNRKAPATPNPAFAPRENLVAPEIEWLLSLTEDDFRRLFKNSAIRRTKWRGLIRNACIAAGNTARGQRAPNDVSGQRAADKVVQSQLQARLAQLAASSDPLIAEHANWALAQLAP